MKVVIANSVGRDKYGNYYIHFPSRWTARMGKTRDFCYYPYELAYLSTLLKRETDLEVKMIDGNYLGLNADDYISLLIPEKPDFLVMETASPLYKEDLKIALFLKERYRTKLVFCGQHPTAFPEEVLADGIDYVCLGEYEYTVLEIISGKETREIAGLYPNRLREPLDINSLPFPEDDDISRFNYTNIGGCDYREIELFASRGCPYKCKFCVCGNLYYARPNWRSRNVGSIIEEIKYLINRYPRMEGIFFDEEDHVVSKKFILELTEAIRKNNLHHLKYDAMCGYINLDKEMLISMKSAGYYKLRIGIETASEKVSQEALGKRVNNEKLLEILSLAKELGIRMYGTFTFGAMGSTEAEDQKTIRLIESLLSKDLLYDFQRSISTPLPGTPFYRWAQDNEYLLTKDWNCYDGGTPVVDLPDYKREDLLKIYRRCGDIFLKQQLRKKGVRLLREEIRKRGILNASLKSLTVLQELLYMMTHPS